MQSTSISLLTPFALEFSYPSSILNGQIWILRYSADVVDQTFLQVFLNIVIRSSTWILKYNCMTTDAEIPDSMPDNYTTTDVELLFYVASE